MIGYIFVNNLRVINNKMILSGSRIKASVIHFLISACVISIFLYFVLFIWYPDPFDYFYSPFEVLKIVLSVDLVLGPLLTLVLFDTKKDKSELRKDISIVVIIQALAFMWGVHVTYSVRPIFLVFSNDTFYMFSRDELDISTLKRKELTPVFWRPPQTVLIDPPKNEEELKKLFEDYFVNGKPEITIRTERYLPWKEGYKISRKYAINMENMLYNDQNKGELNKFLKRVNNKLENFVFYPVKGTSKKATIAFIKDTGEYAGLIKYTFINENE